MEEGLHLNLLLENDVAKNKLLWETPSSNACLNSFLQSLTVQQTQQEETRLVD